MAFNVEAFIWYLLLIDSVGAIVVSWFFAGWYKKNYKGFWKHFPATKGWAVWYFVLVLIIGWLLLRIGELWW